MNSSTLSERGKKGCLNVDKIFCQPHHPALSFTFTFTLKNVHDKPFTQSLPPTLRQFLPLQIACNMCMYVDISAARAAHNLDHTVCILDKSHRLCHLFVALILSYGCNVHVKDRFNVWNHWHSHFRLTGPPFPSVHRWNKHDEVPCVRAQGGFKPTFSDCKSNVLATRLTQRHKSEIRFRTSKSEIVGSNPTCAHCSICCNQCRSQCNSK